MKTNASGVIAVIVAICALPFSTAEAASRNSSDLLQYIPADTPYVFVSTSPMPDEMADKFEPTIDGILRAYQRILRHVLTEKLLEMSAEDESDEEAEALQGVAEEVLGLMSIEGIRGAGIARESAFALYGNGIVPVLRLELSDSDLFDDAIERIEKKAGESLAFDKADGQEYKYVDLEEVRLIIATIDEQVVVTAVPATYDEAQVSRALGIKTPGKSLKSGKQLAAISKEYGYSGFFTGYIDNLRIAQIYSGDVTGLDKDLFAAMEYEAPEMSKLCSSELMELVGVAPRVVFGYSTISTDRIESSMVIEVRDDIAKGLATIPAPIPGLGIDPGGFMSFGFSMDPMKARDFYEARLDAMEEDPFECEKFAGLQEGVAKGREALQQPLPPVVYSLRGMVANVSDIVGLNLGTGSAPESIDATILFAVENAEALLMMAAMFDPQVAAMNLVPDGKPVKLELAQLASIAEQAYAALTENALSVSIGEGAEANAASVLVADSADPAPFVSMSMDSARYYKMIGDAMMQEKSDSEGEQLPLSMREALRDVMRLSGSLYERIAVDVNLTDRGIEIDSLMTLGD